MPHYYMRVDAVNLGHFVFDTYDISTIRGGSFILLDAIRSLKDKFQGQLEAISNAASQGLFLVYGTENIEELQTSVLQHLCDITENHATFVTAVVCDTQNNFPLVLQQLEAIIHRQQWRFPTVEVPEYDVSEGECFLDGWRPNNPDCKHPSENNLSHSTHFRREKGRALRQKIFNKILQDSTEFFSENTDLCTTDLGGLAKDPNKGLLSGKIAFIHIDGNKFGRIRRELCETIEDRKAFDQVIQAGCHNEFLKSLLLYARNNIDFQTQDQLLRLEVLVWGGDEIVLVVPAWQAWKVINLFFEKAEGLNFKGTALTYSMALIFCHHNAPILHIRELAQQMLNNVKGSFQDELLNSIHYLVLESFDMLSGSLEIFLKKYYNNLNQQSSLFLYANEFIKIIYNLKCIKKYTSREKILSIIKNLNNIDTVNDITNQIYNLLSLEFREALKENITSLKLDNLPDRWYLLSDLWDYLGD